MFPLNFYQLAELNNILFIDTLKIKLFVSGQKDSFDDLLFELDFHRIYRPPKSRAHPVSTMAYLMDLHLSQVKSCATEVTSFLFAV